MLTPDTMKYKLYKLEQRLSNSWSTASESLISELLLEIDLLRGMISRNLFDIRDDGNLTVNEDWLKLKVKIDDLEDAYRRKIAHDKEQKELCTRMWKHMRDIQNRSISP